MKLAGCDWIRQRHGLLLIGPAGVGKSWLACALGHKACREDFSVAYHRLPRLFATLALARGDDRYPKILKALARTDLLILDDWGPEKLNDEQRRDLLKIVEDRYEKRSTIVTSQIPGDHWYDMIGNPTIADALLDRLGIEIAESSRQAVAAVIERRAARGPERVLQPFGQGHEAFAAKNDMAVLKARPDQPEVVDKMVKRLAGDRHAETAHMGKIRQTQPARLVRLAEDHFLFLTMNGPP